MDIANALLAAQLYQLPGDGDPASAGPDGAGPVLLRLFVSLAIGALLLAALAVA